MPQYSEKPTLIILKVEIKTGFEKEFVNWQAKFNSQFVSQDGFVSLEFLSPSNIQKNWLIIQRLVNREALLTWHESPNFQTLLEDLRKIAVDGGVHEQFNQESQFREGVTEVIMTKVIPNQDEAYRKWSAKIHQAEAMFGGFRGVYVQSPAEAGHGHWLTLLQFDTMENLDRWLNSSERQVLLKESAPLISTLESHRMISPYAGWFSSIAKVAEMPPAWKQTMIVLLVLYPIVMLEFKYLNPLISSLSTPIATFIGNALSVSLITFPTVPIAIYFLRWWLTPDKSNPKWIAFYGTLLVLVLYVIEIIIFSMI
ncbi:MAG: antibiotic biosynthesis monooxygenase [Parachlamydiaceae bacterium]|nr:antibiotic biosynthesis monooxygenase [Parachlamydiaceae bacterium]